MMRNNHDPALPAGLHLRTGKLHLEEDRFRFTPIKNSTKTAPRLWERKASTAFLGRTKSRKVWKRFRTSFNSMRALQQLIAAEQEGITDDLHAEINESKNLEFLRGVKRRCLAQDGGDERGRSFLETKWESEMGGRRRKLPVEYQFQSESSSEAMVVDDASGHEAPQYSSTSNAETVLQKDVSDSDESLGSVSATPKKSAKGPAHPNVPHGSANGLRGEMGGSNLNINIHQDDEEEDVTPTPAAEDMVQDLTAEQESTLVRSALRSSLTGEDVELLNDFLSKARTKREAKAAMAVQDAEATTQTIQEEEPVTEFPTPRSRRALEELDANSPSPQKPQVLSPCKADHPGSPAPDSDVANKDPEQAADQQPPASPVGRRSTRVRKLPPRAASGLGVRNMFSLRRAKGTEFVFLQRTEAQELSLATRKNTKQNKGDSVLPKHILPILAQQQAQDDEAASISEGDKDSACSDHKVTRKRVSWNEELVQYEGDGEAQKTISDDFADIEKKSGSTPTPTKQRSEKKKAASNGRSTRSQGLPQKSSDNGVESAAAATTAPTTAAAAANATPRARRVRRLGASGSNSNPAAATTTATSASAASSSPDKRKKLTPKSQRSTLLPTPVSKGASTANSAGKTKTLLQANAGSTPMPRRVRSRT